EPARLFRRKFGPPDAGMFGGGMQRDPRRTTPDQLEPDSTPAPAVVDAAPPPSRKPRAPRRGTAWAAFLGVAFAAPFAGWIASEPTSCERARAHASRAYEHLAVEGARRVDELKAAADGLGPLLAAEGASSLDALLPGRAAEAREPVAPESPRADAHV